MHTHVSCFHKVFGNPLISGKKDFLATYLSSATETGFLKSQQIQLKQKILTLWENYV